MIVSAAPRTYSALCPRKSPEQWSVLLDELSGSGEAVESFCRRRGIRRSTLYCKPFTKDV
jgi:hypothetical protein